MSTTALAVTAPKVTVTHAYTEGPDLWWNVTCTECGTIPGTTTPRSAAQDKRRGHQHQHSIERAAEHYADLATQAGAA